MNNIAPPRGTPEELQAWNNMMDTMVTFIKASTTLMNTITSKMMLTQAAARSVEESQECEESCEACRPTPPRPICGVCPENAKKQEKSPSKVSFQEPAAAEEPKPEGEATEEGAKPDAPAEENAEKTNDADAEKKPDEEASPPKKSSSNVAAEASSTDAKKCICSTVRAKRLEEKEKAEDEQLNEPKDEIIKTCCCGPTDGNTDAEMREMIEKLAKAQAEITELQSQMARLQRLSSTKRFGPHGGPNTASLYKEIMRNNEPCPASPSARLQNQVARPRPYQQDYSSKYNNSTMALAIGPGSAKPISGNYRGQGPLPSNFPCKSTCNAQNMQQSMVPSNPMWPANINNYGAPPLFSPTALSPNNWNIPNNDQYGGGYSPYQTPMGMSTAVVRCPGSSNKEPRRIIVECRQSSTKPPEDSDLY